MTHSLLLFCGPDVQLSVFLWKKLRLGVWRNLYLEISSLFSVVS